MKNLCYFTFLFFLIISKTAFADTFIDCNGCSNYASYAKNTISNTPGIYKVHVADFDNNILSSYSITVAFTGGEPGIPPYIKQVRAISSPSQVLSEFEGIMAIKIAMENDAKDFEVPTHIIDSVWDLYGDIQTQNAFLVWWSQNVTFSQHAMNLLNTVSGWANLSFPMEIKFSDGSVIVLTLSYIIQDGVMTNTIYEIDFERSYDAFGNKLVMPASPTSDGNQPGYVNIPGGSTLQDFLDAAARAGIPIVWGSGGGSGSGKMVCNLEGRTFKCVYYPK